MKSQKFSSTSKRFRLKSKSRTFPLDSQAYRLKSRTSVNILKISEVGSGWWGDLVLCLLSSLLYVHTAHEPLGSYSWYEWTRFKVHMTLWIWSSKIHELYESIWYGDGVGIHKLMNINSEIMNKYMSMKKIWEVYLYEPDI